MMSKVHWMCLFLLIAFKRMEVVGKETDKTDPDPEEMTEIEEDSEEMKDLRKDLDLETQDQVAILKQINRVNDDGSYTFGYEAADGSFKIETRDVNGNVKGIFGFINENGELKKVSYSANNGTGFQSARTSNIPPLPGMSISSDEEIHRGFVNGGYSRANQAKAEPATNRIDLPNETTPVYENIPEISSGRLPVYIFGSSTPAGEENSSSRPVVIQHIPRVRPTPASRTTIPTESEEILLKPLLSDLAPKRTSDTNFISFGTSESNSDAPDSTKSEEKDGNSSVIQVIRPRAGPFKRVMVTKRPVVITTTSKAVTTTEYKSNGYSEKSNGKESSATTESGKGLRRQSGTAGDYVASTPSSLVTSGTEDNPDVYGGRQASRPYPINAYRTLFGQIPQHQRILQNSYNQNRDQYLTAGLGNAAVSSTTPEQMIPSTTQDPNQVNGYAGAPTSPQGASTTTSGESNYVSIPVPDIQNPRPFELQPNYLRRFLPVPPAIEPSFHSEQSPNQIFIPPSLLEHLIRILLATRQRLTSQGQQAVILTLSTGNVPPELLANRYDPRYYQPRPPYPYYPHLPPNSYSDPLPSRPPYDPRYPLSYYPTFLRIDPQQSRTFSPVPVLSGYQSQTLPYDADPTPRQNLNPPLPGYQRFQPPARHHQSSNVVERSSTYRPDTDSTTPSATTTAAQFSRRGPVRNVEILGQINEDGQSSKADYDSSSSSSSGAKPKK